MRTGSSAFVTAYDALKTDKVKLLLATYFGQLQDNLALACNLPVHGLHIDAINAREEVEQAVARLPADKVLSLGVDQWPQHLENRPERCARLA